MLVGMRAGICVDATARSGPEFGHPMPLVRDAIGSFSREEMTAAFYLDAPPVRPRRPRRAHHRRVRRRRGRLDGVAAWTVGRQVRGDGGTAGRRDGEGSR
ncbi:hypothetical protein ACFY0P_45540 [Streptomyces sp. NPDC001714]|uniref:hypothetical protein n=1 Tax=Streptomyces sp. NPDC001714 TaxID=3364603 RepID=UPI0036B99D01